MNWRVDRRIPFGLVQGIHVQSTSRPHFRCPAGNPQPLIEELRRGGYDPTFETVSNREEMVAALQESAWDLVISDHHLPAFTCIESLVVLKELELDLPFIILSECVEEDAAAVDALKAGANDFIVKGRWARLIPAIERELREARDGSERRLVEKKTKLNENRLAEAQRIAHLGSWEVEVASRSLTWSDEHYRLFGLDPASCQISYDMAMQMISSDDRQRVQDELARALASQQTFSFLYHVNAGSGLRRILHARGQVLRDNQGVAVRLVGTAEDVTEFTQIREDLDKRIQLYDLVMRATNDTVYDWNLETGKIWWNENLQRLLGHDPSANMLDSAWRSANVHPEDRTAAEASLQASFAVQTTPWVGEYRFRRADGSWAHIFDRAHVLYGGTKPMRIIGSMADISGRKRLEEQSRHAQKMEAVGHLVGGIAHDFNNFLSVILGYTEFVAAAVGPGGKLDLVVSDVAEIKSAAMRAVSLTKQLLAFGRRQVLQPVVMDLNTAVTGMEKMVKHLIGENISLDMVLEKDLDRVEADPGQIEQVILNLILNARDAMPNGGKVTIETRNIRIKSGDVSLLPPGAYVQLSTSDTGVGIDERTKGRLFEPFFTTKERGKGSGLGLSTAYGIVKQSGGHILVDSTLGKGSSFQIFLPRADAVKAAVVAPDPPALDEGVPRTTRKKTVMVVDDDEKIRKMIGRHLKSDFFVLEASDGEQAVAAAQRHDGPIDLMISDVAMPGINGVELSRQLKARRPEILTLYISGYPENAAGMKQALALKGHLLSKPFTMENLKKRVEEELELSNRAPGS